MLSCAALAPRRGSAGRGDARAPPRRATSLLAAAQTQRIPSQTDPQAHQRPSQAVHPRQTGRQRIIYLLPAARNSAPCRACRLCMERTVVARLRNCQPQRRLAPRVIRVGLLVVALSALSRIKLNHVVTSPRPGGAFSPCLRAF